VCGKEREETRRFPREFQFPSSLAKAAPAGIASGGEQSTSRLCQNSLRLIESEAESIAI